eukprot:Protomagalhaensia_wolfi_Nauph_80__1968@NODE_2242_length_1156_cov_37_198747_g1749_i0_p1_GENE_NODE_2242_length_1156_cov_37_198747_g1749_i0NODE_2242_length_1156_cov_37_198747_g1749_i0_p1_ORF_typecomplete_len381_score55_30AAR2/PF05282_11/1_1e48RWPRK/PF02042_15/0_36_NODE_2242_length_1156_cov_37_198747_g1749_i01371144
MRPGAHFIYWNRDCKEDYLMNGEFCYLSQREVIVYRWSKRCFLRIFDEEELARYRMGHEDLSLLSRAAAYPKEYVQPWNDVAYAISRIAIKLFQGKDLMSKNEQDLSEYVDSAEARFDERPGRAMGGRNYSDIPNKIKQRGVTGPFAASISAAGMDRSSDLETLLQSYEVTLSDAAQELSTFDKTELKTLAEHLGLSNVQCLLLAEVQMAYINFLLGSDLSSQQQWKELLVLLGNCDFLSDRESNLGAEVLRLMYGQISQMPDDFVMSEITKSNFIIWTLMSLTEIMKDAESAKIKRRLKILEDMVTKKFKMSIVELWALQEDGPQIVDVVETRS